MSLRVRALRIDPPTIGGTRIQAYLVSPVSLQFPLRAFQPEYQWEPNTVNRVNAYFEEIEERGIQAAEQVSAEVQGVLYDATEALDISFDPNEPLAFQPKV
ncbi:hypothetical protein HPB48_006389 [Haemaphysalis longicornis]|uniref:Uncharacterized protein n=1 Tax=Haemaphysalis longicornis TaxID=44386 RepID=A0A9J6FKF1_HAELO|nr:hypothetical protein HPB48_006389 [Haemaphysalis longicornis]